MVEMENIHAAIADKPAPNRRRHSKAPGEARKLPGIRVEGSVG